MRLSKLLVSIVWASAAFSQSFLYDIDALAGRAPAPDGIDVEQARFSNMNCVDRDEAGNIYLCTNSNGNIYRLTPDGSVFRVFGAGIAGFASGGPLDFGDGGRALDAHGNPVDLALDQEGNIYFVQTRPGQLRKITPDGIVTRVAGTSESGFSGDGGPAIEAQLRTPLGVAVGVDGSLYISDAGNDRIRRVTPDGFIQTIAGGGFGAPTPQGVPALQVRLPSPRELNLDAEGNIYVADASAEQVYRISPQGIIRVIAGAGPGVGLPVQDGLEATQVRLHFPSDAAVASTGEVYIADQSNQAVLRVETDGTLSVIRPGPAATFGPGSIKLEPDGGLLAADVIEDVIWRISPDGVSTALTRRRFDGSPGPATGAVLYFPNGVLLDADENPLVVDSFQFSIRRLNPDDTLEVIVGGAGFGRTTGPTPTPEGPFGLIRDAAVDSQGNLYFTDYSNHQVRMVRADGTTEPLAGNGEPGFSGDGGPGRSALIAFPRGIAVSPDGDVYFSDSANHRVRRIRNGFMATVAGSGVRGFFGEGVIARAAAFNSPRGLAFDAAGNLYIADTFNHRIRKVTPEGVITTFAGNGEKGHSGDGGPATEARLNEPHRLTVDRDGYLYIADSFNHVIRMIAPNGTIHTIAGSPMLATDFGDGGPALQAKLNLPKGVAVRSNGDVVFSDNDNHRVRILKPRPRIAGGGVVNAASFAPRIAPSSIASVFGTNLAGMAESAGTTPLPAELAFSSVSITDSEGAEHDARLYFASRTQTNLLVPAGVAIGPATLTVRRTSGAEHQAPVEVAAVSPGLFEPATFVIVRADGTRETGVVEGPLVTGEGDEVFLTLFGTGLRNAVAVSASVGAINAPVLFAGEQGQFEGLDQVNLGPLPEEALPLLGEAPIGLTVDGAETVSVVGAR